MLQLDSPVLLNAEFEAMRAYMGETRRARSTAPSIADGGADALRDAIERIRREAEDARARRLRPCHPDRRAAVAGERAAIPMILAAGAVHTHLVRQQLRTFTSLNVRSAECLDVHYFAVLIGVGATTVNAYLARGERSPTATRAACSASSTLEDCLARYKKAIDQGLLKIMSKMGISVLSAPIAAAAISRRSACRARWCAEFFPGMPIAHLRHRPLRHRSRRCSRCTRAPATRTRSPLPIGGFYRYRRGGETPCLRGAA